MKDDVRVYLVAALPPPLGGMTIWTRAFLDGARAFGIDATLRRVGPRTDAEIRRVSSRIGRIGRNVLMPAAEVVFSEARGCDVVHVCASGPVGIWSGLLTVQAAALRGLPAVLHVHSSLARIGTAARAWIDRLVKHPLVRLVTPSHEDAASHHAYVLIDNLVSDRFLAGPGWTGPTPGKTLRLLYLGWLIREKGLFELVEAVSRVDDVTLDLIGPDVMTADSTALKQLVERKGLTSRVVVKTSVPHDELPALMASYDALVLPSHAESFGMVTAEAMLLGLPVIGTQVGVLWDLPEETFVPVPPNDVEALTQALGEVVRSKETVLPKLSRAAKAPAHELYASDAVLKRWRQLYEVLLAAR